MRDLKVIKPPLADADKPQDLRGKTPGELIEMVDELTREAWGDLNVGPTDRKNMPVTKSRLAESK